MTVKKGLKRFAIITAALEIAGIILIISIYSFAHLIIFLIVYSINIIFAASNFYVINKRGVQNNQRFVTYFYGSLLFRFVGAIIVVILGIKLLDSYQIFFSVSFIFSYLCNSVIEIIYLNKIIRTES